MKPTITTFRRLLLLAAIPALVLAACTQDDALTPGGGDESRTAVTFTAAIQNAATPATRTATGTDATQTLWTADDRIAVFMLPKGGKIPADTLPAAHNVPYSIDPATGVMTQAVPMIPDFETGSFVPGAIVPMYYPMTHDEVDFVAYYPYEPVLEVDNPYLVAPYIIGTNFIDQSTAEYQQMNDFLYSDNARGIRRSKDAVSLRFRHLNAKLRLDITLAEDLAGGKVTAVKLSGMPYAVDFDMRDGSVNKLYSSFDGRPIPCLPLPSPTAGTGAAATFTALVPPHSGADYPGRQITVTVDGEEYTGLLPDTDDYAGNTMYAYPVRVTPQGVTIFAPNDDVLWTDTKPLPQGYDLTVANETELRRFAELVNTGGKLPNGTPAAEAKVLQTADITLTVTQEWAPIGIGSYRFLGTYNGDGHTITGLTITTASAADASNFAYAGLFGYAGKPILTDGEQGAVLTGIHLRKVQIDIPAGSGETYLYVGSIVGSINNSTLSLCSAEGTVKVSSGAENVCVGGIAGYNYGSTISRCRAAVKTKATSTATEGFACAGEITGMNEMFSFILSCEAQGSPVTAETSKSAYAGGITGFNGGISLIAFCRTGANVVKTLNGTGFNYAGGLVGSNIGYLYSCYSRATAEATGTNNRAGAIVGNSQPDRMQYCYGTGATGPGTSPIAADPGLGIYYETSPGSDAIYGVMKGYTGIVESIPGFSTYYPRATRHTPAAYPAHGITPRRVKWGPSSAVWQRGTNTSYPEIDMTYDGEDNAAPQP